MNNMMYTSYTLTDSISLLIKQFLNIDAFPLIALAVLIYVIIVTANLKNTSMKYLPYWFNLLIIGFILFKNGGEVINNIDSFFNGNPLKNIYFYLFNMIIALLMIANVLTNNKNSTPLKGITLVLYYFILTHLLLMLYVSNYLNNILLLVSGNTYSLIYPGNLLALVMYGVLIINWLFFSQKTKKHRLGPNL